MLKKKYPFKTTTLKPERKYGLTVRSVEDIINELPHKYKYDEDGNLMYETVVYKGQTYIKQHSHDITENRKSEGVWRSV